MSEKSANNNMHESRCSICKSEHRKEIDEKILLFKSSASLAVEYPGLNEHAIANHGRMTGLVDQRMKNKRGVLNAIIERGMGIMNTSGFRLDAGHVIKATELYAKLDGQLIEKHDHVIHGSDEELHAKVRKLGSDGSDDSSNSESDTESNSNTEDTGVDNSS